MHLPIKGLLCIGLTTALPSFSNMPSLEDELDEFLLEYGRKETIPSWSGLAQLEPPTIDRAMVVPLKINFASSFNPLDIAHASPNSMQQNFYKNRFLEALGSTERADSLLSEVLSRSLRSEQYLVPPNRDPPIAITKKGEKLFPRILKKDKNGAAESSKNKSEIIPPSILGPRVRKIFQNFWDELSKTLKVQGQEYIDTMDDAFNWLWRILVAPPDGSVPIIGTIEDISLLDDLQFGEIQKSLIWSIHNDVPQEYQSTAGKLVQHYRNFVQEH